MAMDDYYRAQQDVMLYESRVTSYQIKVSNIQNDLNTYQAAIDKGDPAATPNILENIKRKLAQAEQGLADANSDLNNARQAMQTALDDNKADPTNTIKSPEATNEPQSDADTDEKYSDTTNTPAPIGENFDAGIAPLGRDGKPMRAVPMDDEEGTRENRSGVPIGAERGKNLTKASAEWAETKDLRVIIRVPKTYLKGPAAGPSGMLNNFGGILFPYTPTISYDTQAVYGSVNPVHSNYTQYFYKNSQVGQINISGKFTVQNEKEGKVWLGVVHLLRGLTKMRWGSDANAGSPPPVCRLEAYGDFMLRNVPVVISNFKFDLPDNVDYMAVKGEYKNTLVPTVSTLNVTLNVMYSRREMQDYSVDSWLQGNLRGQGYL